MSFTADAFGPPARAWVRGISNVYASCLRDNDEPIDVTLARAQHAAYVRALEQLGVLITHVPADHGAADCCFIEDTAVLLGDRGLLTKPGAAARRRETQSVATALRSAGVELVEMQGSAQLDGGDVLRIGSVLLVGLSERTNEAGAGALEACAAEHGLTVRSVRVTDGLHLKSAMTLLDPKHVLVAGDSPVDTDVLRDLNLELLVTDAPGANVLAIGRHVLVSATAPRTAELARDIGLTPVMLDISELHLCDGALTCLSLRQAPPGGWCA